MPNKHNVTTSIRLSPELRKQLEHAARTLHRGKSWIIIHALESYLEKLQLTLLADEARRQSLLIAAQDDEEENKIWEDNADTTGWE